MSSPGYVGAQIQYGNIHQAFEALLQGGNLQWSVAPIIDWTKQPYYQEQPEPAPPLPWIVYDVPDSAVEQKLSSTGVYVEEFDIDVFAVCLQQHIVPVGSPQVQGSVFHYLDSFRRRWQVLDSYGQWRTAGFVRVGWGIKMERERAPGSVQTGAGGRIWTCSAKYKLAISVSSTGNYTPLGATVG